MAWLEATITPLPGLAIVHRRRQEDRRGYFSRFFCATELRLVGFELPIAQVNHTLTHRRGSVRGLHFQHPPFCEDKFVSCLRGSIFDVAVDLRRGSPTFLKWHGEVLTGDNGRSLYIPQGFAHGFQTMEDDCELIYLHSRPYAAEAEGALHVGDPAVGITWPLPLADISERDSSHAFINADFTGI